MPIPMSTSGPVAVATLLLGGCAHTPPQTLAWRIEPVLRISPSPGAVGPGPLTAQRLPLDRAPPGQEVRPEAPPVAAVATPVPALAGLRTEVVNGNGRTGAAARMRQWLKAHGVTSTRTANQRPFDTAQTTVQYTPGHQAQAVELARQMAVPVKLAEIPELQQGIDVRMVLGHDLRKANVGMRAPHARKGLAHMPAPFRASTGGPA